MSFKNAHKMCGKNVCHELSFTTPSFKENNSLHVKRATSLGQMGIYFACHQVYKFSHFSIL